MENLQKVYVEAYSVSGRPAWGIGQAGESYVYVFESEQARDLALTEFQSGLGPGWSWGHNIRDRLSLEARHGYRNKTEALDRYNPVIEPVVPATTGPRFTKATGTFAAPGDRYLILDSEDPAWTRAFSTVEDRDDAFEKLVLDPSIEDEEFRGVRGRNARSYDDITPEPVRQDTVTIGPIAALIDTTPTQTAVDYRAKYEQLVKDLRAQAEARNWCPEFEEFARKANIPAELVEKTVRVTYEFRVPRSTGIRTNAQAHRAFANLSAQQRAAAVVAHEVI